MNEQQRENEACAAIAQQQVEECLRVAKVWQERGDTAMEQKFRAKAETAILIRDKIRMRIMDLLTPAEAPKSDMQRLRYVPSEAEDWILEDVQKLVEICETQGYVIDPGDVFHAWESYSDSCAASWLIFDDLSPETVVAALKTVCVVEDMQFN